MRNALLVAISVAVTFVVLAVLAGLAYAFGWFPAGGTGSTPGQELNLAPFYVVALVLFAGIPYVVDIVAAYWFADKTRNKLIDRVAGDGLSVEGLKLLLAELDEAPPGIPGLSRY